MMLAGSQTIIHLAAQQDMCPTHCVKAFFKTAVELENDSAFLALLHLIKYTCVCFPYKIILTLP